MSESQEQNRSELPTPFKLARARQRGVVARGMDLGFLTSLAALFLFLWLQGPRLAQALAACMRMALVSAPQVAPSPATLLAVIAGAGAAAARPVIFLVTVVFLVVLVFELVQTGFVFSSEPLKLDFNRLNPANGLKRLFSLRLLIETGKNVLKLAVYSALAAFVIWTAAGRGLAGASDAGRLSAAMADQGLRLLLLFAAAAVVFAGLDQLIVRGDFLRRMRMSRREVRRELRDREGEPRLKQKRKQMHAQFAKLSQSLRNIRGADVLVTNPTHYAVGLAYDARRMIAPKIVAQGRDLTALRLRRLAFVYGVTVIENPPLARALFHRGELGEPIPEVCYGAVADVYRGLQAARQSQDLRRA